MKKLEILLFAALGLSLAACNNTTGTDEQFSFDKTDVRIEPVITRATSTDFEDGDKIGVSIIKSDKSVYADNACLSYGGKVFSGDLKWYADGGESCSVMAYYPYVEGGMPTEFTVAADQSNGAGSSDFMTASKSEVYPQSGAVMAVFRHQLTQLIINIDNKADAQVSEVLIKGVLPTVKVITDEDGTVSVSSDNRAEVINIKAQAVEAGKKYRVIIAPQSRGFEVSVKVNGATLVSDVNEAELQSGYSYSVGVEILADMVDANISGEIENWENGGGLTGNIKDESEAEEHEDYIVYHGKNYRTAEIGGRKWMVEPLAYIPDGLAVSDDATKGKIWYPYSSDGTNATVLKDEESVKTYGYLYSYEAAMGTALTDDNFKQLENAQGICPKGWHIPSRAEYYALFGTSNSKDGSGESGTQTDPTALFWDASVKYATIAKANEAGFNFIASGTVANKKYNTLICDESNCTVEEMMGNISLTYLMTSTANKKTSTAFQMFAGITTFTSTNSLGKLSVAFSNHDYGLQLRCIRNE